MKHKKPIVISILVGLALAVVFSMAAFAICMFAKELAGLGQMTFTDEVRVVDITVQDLGKVKVKLEPTSKTVAGKSYSVRLYLDQTEVASQTVSWTAGEISERAKKTLSFDGLDLSAITRITVEVTNDG